MTDQTNEEELAEYAKESPKIRAIQHKGAVRSIRAVLVALALDKSQVAAVLEEVGLLFR